MRLESIRFRGLGPFRDEQHVDLTQLGDALEEEQHAE